MVAEVSEFLNRFRFGHHQSPAPQQTNSNRQNGPSTNLDLSHLEQSTVNQRNDPVEHPHPSFPPQSSANSVCLQVPKEILAVESIDREDGQDGSRDKRIHNTGKDDEVITYKRRPRTRREMDKAGEGDELCNYKRTSPVGCQKRKNPDDRKLKTSEDVSDGETDTADTIDHTHNNSGKLWGRLSKEVEGFGSAETLSTIKTWKRVIGIQKTLAPKRVIGQYFLDLGQSDFSHTTCPTCGLFYARGHENDEKVHKTFHRNFTQGIVFKGWQTERVARRLDDKGNRVIVVLAEDAHHQAKVREVIGIMELELGLTPGWLLQRSCKVYLFISSSKRIVGCLMAEPIKSAFRVVSAQCQSSEKGAKINEIVLEQQNPSILKNDLQSVANESCRQFDRNVSELPATQNDETDESEQGSTDGKSRFIPKSNSAVSSEAAICSCSLSSICGSESAASGNSPECISEVKRALPHPSVSVKPEPASVRDRMKTPKITDFFALRSRHEESQVVFKSERDVIDAKADVSGAHVKVEMDEESPQNVVVSGQEKQPHCRQLENKEKVLPSNVYEAAEDEGKPLASGSREIGVQVTDSKEGRKHRNNVMVFGNIKFSREMASRKRASKERTQDLGSAILCTKTAVPAVCGVRVIWVSHTERRKGIGSHLLDAMRRTFCLGLALEPSQFAFSQPTPEGRKFAARYCKTDEFLVYTTS